MSQCMVNMAPPALDDQYVNVTPELDSDEHGGNRVTAPGNIWRVAAVDLTFVSIYCAATGAAINPSVLDLANPAQFVKLEEPPACAPAVVYIDLHDRARWRKVDAFIEGMTPNIKDICVDFNSANFQPEGLYLNGVASLFVSVSTSTSDCSAAWLVLGVPRPCRTTKNRLQPVSHSGESPPYGKPLEPF